ncbi:MAG: maleylpyruvate isomerase family mycothiol-dependent enzyme [Mycobacteriales bacterium]
MTASCHRADLPAYAERLTQEGERFAQLITGAGGDAAVPTCPGWTVRDVSEHVGGLYRWAETMVRTLSPERVPASALDLTTPEDFPGLPDWVRAGLTALVATVRAADPDAPMWAWGSDKHARFWGRRMLFETVVHRADVDYALGNVPRVDGQTAVDGVDEFLDNLPHAAYFAPKVTELRGAGETLELHETDSGTSWRITFGTDGFTWQHADRATADAGIEGSAEALLLFVYGRAPGAVKRSGDDGVVDRWVERSAI